MNSDSENECLIEERSSDEEFSSSESESDDDCLDSARDWCQIDVTSPLPSHPKFPFTGNPGIKVSIGDSGDPLEYFNLFLDDEMFSFIVEETNKYAESFFENTELTPASRALKWKNANKEEMKRFIALLLLQGVVQKPVEKWFWSKKPILSTPFFRKVMGTGFNENYNDYGLSKKSVLTLIHEMKGKGYCISTENFYTSPELAEILIGSKTDICGTLRPNRKGLPVSLKSSTVKKGEIIAFQKDHIGFRMKLIERLIEEGGSDSGSRNFVGPKISENVVRLVGRHFPSYVESDSPTKKNIAKMYGMQP
ncbi:piggyBac transposable element-derived protein 4 [Trichonephila clavipes]|nr:piggyBac transposable element-derived protein 4 [Trichonephila clavipes]